MAKDIDCQISVLHPEIVSKVENNLSEDEELISLSEFFKVFGDSTRIKILQALYVSEMCVCDIAYVTKVSRSGISHQLKILRNMELVKYRKEGKVVFYSLKDSHVEQIIQAGLEHISEK
ncbi:MAG: ArsR/SmtB family transcription factor [Spirochaetia bacterium]